MNIYVGNLALETTEAELRQEFMTFGEVLAVTIMNDRYIGSGQTRGYAYVEMVSRSEGASAIASLEGKLMRDRVISVIEALPLSNKEASPADIRSNNRANKKRARKY